MNEVKEIVMKNMKKWIATIAISVFALAGSIGSADAITIDLIQNGGFEEGGGSLAHWNTYGDVGLITELSGNHLARLGGGVNTGNSMMSQGFKIQPWTTLDQTLSFSYGFTFMDVPTTWSSIDIFATRIFDDNGTLIETPLLLATYDSSSVVSLTGYYNALLSPQLDPGYYYLKFKLNESSGANTDSFVDIDNVSLTTSVPEPNTLLLLGSALVGFAAIGRGLRKKK